MPRQKVSSEGKSPSASQDESGVTSADRVSEFLAIMIEKFAEVKIEFEKIHKRLDDRDKRIEDLREAHQPRLAMEADV